MTSPHLFGSDGSARVSSLPTPGRCLLLRRLTSNTEFKKSCRYPRSELPYIGSRDRRQSSFILIQFTKLGTHRARQYLPVFIPYYCPYHITKGLIILASFLCPRDSRMYVSLDHSSTRRDHSHDRYTSVQKDGKSIAFPRVASSSRFSAGKTKCHLASNRIVVGIQRLTARPLVCDHTLAHP